MHHGDLGWFSKMWPSVECLRTGCIVPAIYRNGANMPFDEHAIDQWVVIGGGSRGFGLIIAQQLAARGKKLVIIGREAEQLNTVTTQLLSQGASEVKTFAVDLCKANEQADEELVKCQKFCQENSIGLCVAAVGKSDRGFLESISASELKNAFDINVVSSLQLIQCALPGLRKAKGQIALIASLAGVIATPGMGAYAITKSGQVALARQLRQELSGVGVTLLCCGPIARDDAGARYSELAAERSLPEHLRAPGGGVRLKGLDPVRLADRLLKAAVEGKKELIVPWKAKLLMSISAFFPSLAELIINKLYSKR